MSNKKLHFETLQLHVGQENPDPATDARAVPIYQTTSYVFRNSQHAADRFGLRDAGNIYGRLTNSTQGVFEDRVAALEGGVAGLAVASGAAAVTYALQNIVQAGDHIVAADNLYGGSFNLITHTLATQGVTNTIVNVNDLEALEAAIQPNTKVVYAETFGNPNSDVTNLEAVAAVAHKHNIPLVADTTVIPFTEFSAHELGVDIEVVSTTKYLSGGATTLGGIVIDYGGHPEFARRLHDEMLFNLGAYMTPHVAYMQNLGLENLKARYEYEVRNTVALVNRLRTLPAIKSVNYVGLPDNPYYELAQRQFGKTAGCMFTIDLESKEACFKFINSLKLIRRATNLFDNRTLAIHPASTIFGPFNDEQRAAMDVLDTTIRISVGMEDVDDLFDDFKQALA